MAQTSLGQLLKNADILQRAARLTKQFSELNDTIMQILHDHLDKVDVHFAPDRPHDWDNRYAVLVVAYGDYFLKMPVPELNRDWRLAYKVKIKMNKNLVLGPQETIRFFADLENWDQPIIISTEVVGADMNREFMVWLAEIGEKIAAEHPNVEIVAYAKRWQSFPRGSALVTTEYSGHNFARSVEGAGVVASNLRYRAELSIPTSLSVNFCFRTGGARFYWERAGGLQGPQPIYNRGLNDEEPIWTPAQALAWARKNWKPNVNLPEPIKAAIFATYGLGTQHMYTRSDGGKFVCHSISPAELQPEGYIPPQEFAWANVSHDEDED
jgi:hypothetical protein